MDKRIIESIVPVEGINKRIDSYLAARFTYQSREEWKKEICSGKVSVNGIKIFIPHKRVNKGDIVSYSGTGKYEPVVDTNIAILYEDDVILGINKTGNLPVHPSGRYFNNTLVILLERQLGKKVYPLHRLDRETSGIILLAKNREVASQLQSNFYKVSKSYIAIVHGRIPVAEFEVNTPLGADPTGFVRKKRCASEKGTEEARTLFKRLFSFDDYTLVKATPLTGRLHQIRIHCNYAGYPIIGDKLYGKNEKYYLEFIEDGLTDELLNKLEFPRCALHARSILFFHPVTGSRHFIKAPVPYDFNKFIEDRREAKCQNR